MWSKTIPLLLSSALLLAACTQPSATEQAQQPSQNAPATAKASVGTPQPLPPGAPIQWLGFEQAVAANGQSPKLIFIDVYTDWCGWCKVMDQQTFSQTEVADFMNTHFHSVKMNAETEGPIRFNNQQFDLVDGGRGRKIHTLAHSLLDGQLSYPSYVYLTPNFERITISKGFKPAEQFMAELRGIVEQYK